MKAMQRLVMCLAMALSLLLVLAACGSTRVVGAPGLRSTPVRVSQPRYGATAVVRRGDTLYRIATDNGISVLDLAMWNSVPPPYTIYPGQRLRLYPSSGAQRPYAGRASPPPPAVSGSPRPPVASPPRSAPGPVMAPPSPVAWRWPAEGELSGRYVPGDATRQGIDIAGQGGSAVRAAGDGVIVYSGAGLVGYGELIIVKHNEAWLSAYGHNRARLVNEGEMVKAGQQIAEMGRSGAARDMLHFEIRYNGKPVDPLSYLPKR